MQCELFEMNLGKDISVWSENPVESWNKFVWAYQSGVAARARLSSIKDNLLIESHRKVASLKPRPSCLVCGEIGHTAGARIHSGQQSAPNNADDEEIIRSMLAISE